MNDTIDPKQVVLDTLRQIEGIQSVKVVDEPPLIPKDGGVMSKISHDGTDIPDAELEAWLIPILRQQQVHGTFILSTGPILNTDVGYLEVELDSSYKWAVKLLHVCDYNGYSLIRVSNQRLFMIRKNEIHYAIWKLIPLRMNINAS